MFPFSSGIPPPAGVSRSLPSRGTGEPAPRIARGAGAGGNLPRNRGARPFLTSYTTHPPCDTRAGRSFATLHLLPPALRLRVPLSAGRCDALCRSPTRVFHASGRDRSSTTSATSIASNEAGPEQGREFLPRSRVPDLASTEFRTCSRARPARRSRVQSRMHQHPGIRRRDLK